MSKINFTLPATLVGLLFAGSALAVQPVSGNLPFFDNATVVNSTTSRAEVRAEAAAHQPAAGEMTATATNTVAPQASALARSEVRAETAAAARALGHFPAASGIHS